MASDRTEFFVLGHNQFSDYFVGLDFGLVRTSFSVWGATELWFFGLGERQRPCLTIVDLVCIGLLSGGAVGSTVGIFLSVGDTVRICLPMRQQG